jgi:mRNA-degrading endonuclease RelE of RelBE toxin-antitoxin system
MRSVRYSKTFTDEFEILLDQGEVKFGSAVVESKKQLVRATITGHLATFPLTGHVEPEHGLYIYTVRRSPFVLLYDFDDDELRIHMVVHKGADRTTLDPTTVEW